MANPDELARRVEELFAEAAALDAAQREAFLDRACDGNASLIAEVRSLLEADERVGTFLDTPVSSPELFSFEDAGTDALLGERLGPYRLVQRLGAGGMSVVYLGQREDAEFAQRVAVKVLKRGMDSEEIVSRFRAERRLLASLEHPHIARFLDGGVAADGRLYLVMECIDGEPITSACATRNVSAAARLRLFRDVCEAVHFAHQRLVVHRDLKPSNIFVTTDGRAKLLDFGIAKVLSPEDSDSGGTPTKTATRFMTPRYASPEQLRGERTTIATDIYSLGVILRELLEACGGFTGDLELIVRKACHEAPERRYASAAALSEDLRLHELGFPVSARLDTFGYRFGKFIRRNPTLSGAIAFAAAMIAAFGVVLSVQLRNTAQERDRANLEAETARQTAEFLENLFRVSDPDQSRGRAITAREILNEGARRVRTELTTQPLVQARLLRTIGRVHANLGLYDEARPLLEQALEIQRRELPPEDLEIAASLDALANVHRILGDTPGALTLAEEALYIRESLLDANDRRIALSLNNVAVLKTRERDLEGARVLLERAIAIREQLDGVDAVDLVGPLHGLANIQIELKNYDAARGLFERALSILEAELGHDHPRLTAPLSSLAEIASEQGRHAEAESLQLRAIDIDVKARGPEHDMVGGGLADLALIRLNAGSAEQALDPAQRAVATLEQSLGKDHPNVAAALFTLAQVQAKLGDTVAAQKNGARAVRITEARFPPGHPSITEAHHAYDELPPSPSSEVP